MLKNAVNEMLPVDELHDPVLYIKSLQLKVCIAFIVLIYHAAGRNLQPTRSGLYSNHATT